MATPSEGAIKIEGEVHFNKYSNNRNRQYRNPNFTQGLRPPPVEMLFIVISWCLCECAAHSNY